MGVSGGYFDLNLALFLCYHFTDPGPYNIANLTLWFYENKYLERLYKLYYFCAKRLNNSFRLIDDITSINSDGIFHSHAQNVYPSSLILNK